MPFRVGLDHYQVEGIHGYFEHEHSLPQPFVVSVRVDLIDEVRDEVLSSTVDYALLQKAVDAVILESKPIRLLEKMATNIAPLPHPGGLPFIEYTWNRTE
jgi:dihydroneopterin aldolase/2-amino-4-hydroxy-6-hydroxymethyldihydropteridine diphosphokinase